MLNRFLLALAVGIGTFLICLLVGTICVATGINFINDIGAFLTHWAAVIGLVFGVLFFASGRTSVTL